MATGVLKLDDIQNNLEPYEKEILFLFFSCNCPINDISYFYVRLISDYKSDKNLVVTLTLQSLENLTIKNHIVYDYPFGWKLSRFSLFFIEKFFGDRLKLNEIELEILLYLFNENFLERKEDFIFNDLLLQKEISSFSEAEIVKGILSLKQRGYIYGEGFMGEAQNLEVDEKNRDEDYIKNNTEFYLNIWNFLIRYSLYITDKTCLNEYFDRTVLWTQGHLFAHVLPKKI